MHNIAASDTRLYVMFVAILSSNQFITSHAREHSEQGEAVDNEV